LIVKLSSFNLIVTNKNKRKDNCNNLFQKKFACTNPAFPLQFAFLSVSVLYLHLKFWFFSPFLLISFYTNKYIKCTEDVQMIERRYRGHTVEIGWLIEEIQGNAPEVALIRRDSDSGPH